MRKPKPALIASKAAEKPSAKAWTVSVFKLKRSMPVVTPERWVKHAKAWQAMGCTHLAIATHNAGDTNVDGHLARIAEYQQALAN